MKSIIAIILIIFSINVSAQNTKPPKSAQDSVNELNAAADKFADSLISKTSIKDFREFLRSNLLAKVYDEATFVNAYDFFIRSKVNEWMTKRKKQ